MPPALPSASDLRHGKSRLLLDKATAVADLAGWTGAIVTQPWYQWLSPTDILLRGGSTNSDDRDGDGTGYPDAGQEDVLYRAAVGPNPGGKTVRAAQTAVPLREATRRTLPYGGVKTGVTSLSPDGRWLLYKGEQDINEDQTFLRSIAPSKTPPRFFSCAVAIDGSADVAWPMILHKNTLDRHYGNPTSAAWLPDSSGILETYADWYPTGPSARITGQIHLLSKPSLALPLPPVSLGKIPDTSFYGPSVWPVQMTQIPGGDTIALQQITQSIKDDPALTRGGPLHATSPDYAILYLWNWIAHAKNSPSVRRVVIPMLPGYSLTDAVISTNGDRIVWTLMDRPHHAVVATGMTIHRSFGTGRLGLWVTDLRGIRPTTQEIGYVPVPFGKEADLYQRFGLGHFLPNQNRISFQIARTLYTVPLP